MALPANLVVATHNAGKLAEWRALLGPVDGGHDVGLPDVDETADTFTGNALLKARAAHRLTGRPSLGEDAGLLLPDGLPGVRTRRFMDGHGGWHEGMEELLRRHGVGAAASYVCALALVDTGREVAVQAAVSGTLQAREGEGPGVAPWFRPAGERHSWAQLGPSWRHAHDHRAAALSALYNALD